MRSDLVVILPPNNDRVLSLAAVRVGDCRYRVSLIIVLAKNNERIVAHEVISGFLGAARISCVGLVDKN